MIRIQLALPLAAGSFCLAALAAVAAAQPLTLPVPQPAPRAQALQALLANRAAGSALLRQSALAGDTAKERRFAVQSLGVMHDRGAVDTLLAATRDTDAGVRKQAVIALRKLGDPTAAPRLREILAGRPEAPLAKSALAALGKLGNAGDIPLLRSYLNDGNESVRVHAAAALGMRGSDEGLDTLLGAIDGVNPVAQKNATYALGFIADAKARERLEAILADPYGRWRSYALMALAERDIAAAPPALQAAYLGRLAERRDRTVSAWCLERLAELGTPEAAAETARLSGAGGRLGELATLHRTLQGEN
jgi:HEAT repeat protein